MKKLFLVLALFGLLGGGVLCPAWSSQVLETLIEETECNAVTTAVSGTTYIGDCDKVAFFVEYDETQVGNAISAAVTVYISYDGTNWLQASFYDYAGSSTLQTSETISSDGWYYFWFNKDLTVPQVKVTVTATNTDADDLLDITVYIVKLK